LARVGAVLVPAGRQTVEESDAGVGGSGGVHVITILLLRNTAFE
jgi:hypothetical protein